MNTEEAKWLAAAIDCDGSISLAKCGTRSTPRVLFANTHRAPVELCQRITGLGTLTTVPENRKKGKRKPHYLWAVQRVRDIVTVLEALLPHLLVKRRRARLLYAFCIIRELHFRKSYGDIEWELMERVSELNRTGEVPMSNEERLSSVASDQDRT